MSEAEADGGERARDFLENEPSGPCCDKEKFKEGYLDWKQEQVQDPTKDGGTHGTG